MSVKRSRPGTHPVRTGKAVGPDYPEANFRNPFNAGVDSEYGNTEDKTLEGPTDTPGGMGIGPIRHDYNELFEGK